MSRVIIRLEQINVSSRGREAAFTWAPTSSLADGEVTQCCAGARSRGGEVPPSRPKNTANCQNGIKREKKVNINSITSMEEHGCKSFSEIGRCPSKQITLRDGEFRLAPPPHKHPTQGTSSRSRSILASIPRLLPLRSFTCIPRFFLRSTLWRQHRHRSFSLRTSS